MSLHSYIAPSPVRREYLPLVSEALWRRIHWRKKGKRRTDITARQLLPDRPKHPVPQLVLHHLELLRCQRVGEHVRVHGGEEVDRDEGREGTQEGRLRVKEREGRGEFAR